MVPHPIKAAAAAVATAVVVAVAVSAPAKAQYVDAYQYYADPGNGGGSAYYPFYYAPRYSPRQFAPQDGYLPQSPYAPAYAARGYPPQSLPPQAGGALPAPGSGSPPLYADPYTNGGDPYAPGGIDSRYSLGPNGSRRTVREVPNPTRQPPGTIVIDTATRHLYYTEPNGQALEYGIGVGRQGFAWHGTARVARKAEWPGWTPPADMMKRRPDLPSHMEGGIENPLGARAMYLYQGNRDTMFRIHGTNEPDTIGQAVSSGCIRMMNADVIDLYSRVPVGTRVVVL